VVIPVFNEEESVDLLCEKLHASLSTLGRTYEMVLVDDGSSDGTWDKLVAQTRRIPHLRVIRFRRNFGQTAAMSAGFHAARGDVSDHAGCRSPERPRRYPAAAGPHGPWATTW
jgi:glycosyltransferase involved in cell wall biosynthesis